MTAQRVFTSIETRRQQDLRATVGTLELGTALDTADVTELAQLARGDAAIMRGKTILVTTLIGAMAPLDWSAIQWAPRSRTA